MKGGLLNKMVKCSFTGKEEHPFKGTHLIKNDGSVEFYSSSKAMKNALKLKRDKRKLKWTDAYHAERQRASAQAEYVKAESKTVEDAESSEKAQKIDKKGKKS